MKLLSLTLVNKNNVFIASHEAKTLSSLRILLKIEYYEEDKMSSNYLYDLMKEDVDFSKVTKIKGIMKNSNQKKPLEVVKDYLKRYYKVLVEYLKE